MEHINIRVLIKEPRGFVRILQAIFSILAWSTTANFATVTTLIIYCPDNTTNKLEYNIKYPFDLRDVEVSVPVNCSDDTEVTQNTFPIDFSSSAMLFVLVCMLSLAYSICAALYYSFLTAKYETDPLAPMVDLCLTILLALLWFLMTVTWALNVSDIKHYTHPNYLKEYLPICQEPDSNCQATFPGKWSSLTVSSICGFVCVLLWLGSTWFVFKETTLHKKQTYQQGQQAAGQQLGQQQQQQQQPSTSQYGI